MTAMKKKTSERKRTPFPREVKYTRDFSDDWEKLERSGKHDMHRIKEAVSLLMMNDGSLSAESKKAVLKKHSEGSTHTFYLLAPASRNIFIISCLSGSSDL